MLILILIGPVVSMTDTRLVVSTFSLVTILFLGAPANNIQLLAPTQRLNTNQLPMPQMNSFGFKHYFESCDFLSFTHQSCGATTWVSHTSLLILFITPGPSIWMWIFHFVCDKVTAKALQVQSITTMNNLLIFLPSPWFLRSFPTFV